MFCAQNLVYIDDFLHFIAYNCAQIPLVFFLISHEIIKFFVHKILYILMIFFILLHIIVPKFS